MSTNLQEMGNGCPIYLSEKNFNAVELDIRNNDMNDRMWMLLSEIGNINKCRIPMFYSIEQALQTIKTLLFNKYLLQLFFSIPSLIQKIESIIIR